MYQSFTNKDEKKELSTRVKCLRDLFDEYQIDGYLVPRSDAFQNEYLPEAHERLSFITGFSGSWGLSIITRTSAVLFYDSRYEIQAPKQTDRSVFECVCTSNTTIKEYFLQYFTANKKIGYDGKIHNTSEIKRFSEYAPNVEFIDIQDNLIDKIKSKQTIMSSEIIIHPHEIAGQFSSEKLSNICEILKTHQADAAIITLPESLCWLYNLRANDVPHTPYILSYGIIYANGSTDWYVGKDRISKEIISHLPLATHIKDIKDFYPNLSKLSGNILIDPQNTPIRIERIISDNKNITKIIYAPDPCLVLKSVKNTIEIKACEEAHIIDATAMIQFMFWLNEHALDGITEIDCVKKLEEYRRNTGLLKDISFDTIAGSGPHGAIVHYKVDTESNRKLKDGELFLVDSGGQYLNGTTDITRTFAIGTPTQEMIFHYTLVLKAHLALSMSKFPAKTTGASLDSIARMPLWQHGIDYGHGTGHGVGLYLSVHEGPQSISSRSTVELVAGMLLSNEPGYYRENHYGIRIENIEVVTPLEKINNGDRPMMGFRTLTLVPYEKKLIDKTMLTFDEIKKVNQYHQRIYETIVPVLTKKHLKTFLESLCCEI